MTRLALAALLAALPLAAPAADFTIFIHETPADSALRSDPGAAGQAYWATWAAWSADLAASGAMTGGAPLVPGAPGPDGLILGGYFAIRADSPADAAALAATAPSALRGGTATVAAHLDIMPMSTD